MDTNNKRMLAAGAAFLLTGVIAMGGFYYRNSMNAEAQENTAEEP